MWTKLKGRIAQRFSITLDDLTRRELLFHSGSWRCERVLDVGCGSDSALQFFRDEIAVRVGVDLFAPSLETTSRNHIHTETHQMNVLDIASHFAENSFDAVICNDLIEHLTREDGLRLIARMQRIARYRVVIFTPNGWIAQEEYDGNPHQKHRSGWTLHDLESLDFKVAGLGGLKYLHGGHGLMRWRPRRFWSKVSVLSRPFCHTHPQWAFHLFASWHKTTP